MSIYTAKNVSPPAEIFLREMPILLCMVSMIAMLFLWIYDKDRAKCRSVLYRREKMW